MGWEEYLALYLAHSRCAVNGRRKGKIVEVHGGKGRCHFIHGFLIYLC